MNASRWEALHAIEHRCLARHDSGPDMTSRRDTTGAEMLARGRRTRCSALPESCIIARRASPLTGPGRTAAARASSSGPGEQVAAARANEATGALTEFLLAGFDRTSPVFGPVPDSGDYVPQELNSTGLLHARGRRHRSSRRSIKRMHPSALTTEQRPHSASPSLTTLGSVSRPNPLVRDFTIPPCPIPADSRRGLAGWWSLAYGSELQQASSLGVVLGLPGLGEGSPAFLLAGGRYVDRRPVLAARRATLDSARRGREGMSGEKVLRAWASVVTANLRLLARHQLN